MKKGEVVALALCLDGTSIYAIPAVGFLTGQYLAEELERLMEVVPSVTVLDLKIQLPFLKNHSRRIVDGIRYWRMVGSKRKDQTVADSLIECPVAGYDFYMKICHPFLRLLFL